MRSAGAGLVGLVVLAAVGAERGDRAEPDPTVPAGSDRLVQLDQPSLERRDAPAVDLRATRAELAESKDQAAVPMLPVSTGSAAASSSSTGRTPAAAGPAQAGQHAGSAGSSVCRAPIRTAAESRPRCSGTVPGAAPSPSGGVSP